jgi:uncharacterized protein YjbI with pentapeptide repeats
MDDENSQEFLYRIQLLQALGLESWNDEDVNVVMNNTYDKIKDISVFREIIEKAKISKDLEFLLALICSDTSNADTSNADTSNADTSNADTSGADTSGADTSGADTSTCDAINVDKLVFELLFKYEYFDVFHKCLSEQLRHGRVQDKTVRTMIDILV